MMELEGRFRLALEARLRAVPWESLRKPVSLLPRGCDQHPKQKQLHGEIVHLLRGSRARAVYDGREVTAAGA